MLAKWLPKLGRTVFEEDFDDVVCAELNGAHLKVFTWDRTEGPQVTWVVGRPNDTMHAGGTIRCTKKQLKRTYTLAKKRAEAFARCWVTR